MCEPFRKIEKIFLGEDTFQSTWTSMDRLYEAIAEMCDEYLKGGT